MLRHAPHLVEFPIMLESASSVAVGSAASRKATTVACLTLRAVKPGKPAAESAAVAMWPIALP
jgi:hypothetical protein